LSKPEHSFDERIATDEELSFLKRKNFETFISENACEI
jgi:hypothetical protein